MATAKLYYIYAYSKAFGAKVVSCDKADNGRWEIVLNATLFYPEGGGQPSDTGILTKYRKAEEDIPDTMLELAFRDNGNGLNLDDFKPQRPCNLRIHEQTEQPEVADFTVQVLDVQEKNGIIVHYCDGPIEPGTELIGRVGWDKRFDHMQQHSGEHIVSGMICEHFNCDNVGFHMGKDVVTIDYNTAISLEDLSPIENAANAYILEDNALCEGWYRGAQLDNMEYRSKKHIDGDVRIVQFPGADSCACCGLHVSGSAQVRLVKFISAQKFSRGTRIELVCGNRAVAMLNDAYRQNAAIAKAMATSTDKTYAIYMKQRKELADAEYRAAELEKLYCEQKALQYKNSKEEIVLLFEDQLSAAGLRNMSLLVSEASGCMCAVFGAGNGSYRYAVSKPGSDIKALVSEMNAELHGKGGGSQGFAQGQVEADEESIRAFYSKIVAKRLC